MPATIVIIALMVVIGGMTFISTLMTGRSMLGPRAFNRGSRINVSVTSLPTQYTPKRMCSSLKVISNLFPLFFYL
jgi:hypothetical protein